MVFVLLFGCSSLVYAETRMTWKGTVPPPPSALNSPTSIVANNEVPLIPKKFTAHIQINMTNKFIENKNQYFSLLELKL